jgi:monoamine oxidase
VLFEARQRLGGRILSIACKKPGTAIDLGPAWYWPDTQPLVARLVADLDLEGFPQHDDGSALHLHDPEKAAECIVGKPAHGGAWRLKGGMASVIRALARDIPQERVYLGNELKSLHDEGDRVTLASRVGDQLVEVRRGVPCLPCHNVRFAPDLDDATREGVQATATCGSAGKAVISYERAFWREKGDNPATLS